MMSVMTKQFLFLVGIKAFLDDLFKKIYSLKYFYYEKQKQEMAINL